MLIAFDCDGTLVGITQEEIPRWDVIDMLRLLSEKHTVIVWSGGGKEWAERHVRRLHIETYVNACHSKTSAKELDVDLCFDDEITELAKVNIRI